MQFAEKKKTKRKRALALFFALFMLFGSVSSAVMPVYANVIEKDEENPIFAQLANIPVFAKLSNVLQPKSGDTSKTTEKRQIKENNKQLKQWERKKKDLAEQYGANSKKYNSELIKWAYNPKNKKLKWYNSQYFAADKRSADVDLNYVNMLEEDRAIAARRKDKYTGLDFSKSKNRNEAIKNHKKATKNKPDQADSEGNLIYKNDKGEVTKIEDAGTAENRISKEDNNANKNKQSNIFTWLFTQLITLVAKLILSSLDLLYNVFQSLFIPDYDMGEIKTYNGSATASGLISSANIGSYTHTGLSLGSDHSSSTFFDVFGNIGGFFAVFQKIGLFLAIVIFMWQAFQSLYGPISGGENPYTLGARMAITVAMIYGAQLVLSTMLDILRVPYALIVQQTSKTNLDGTDTIFTTAGDHLQSAFTAMHKDGSTKASQQTNQSSLSDDVSAAAGNEGAIPSSLVSMILTMGIMLAVGKEFIVVLLESVERYVLTGVLYIVSPLAMATNVSEKTKNVFEAWFQMFFTSGLLIGVNVFFLSVAGYGLSTSVSNHASTTEDLKAITLFVSLAMVYAMLRVASHFDDYLGALGLSTARTGQGMGMAVLGGAGAALALPGLAMHAASGTANDLHNLGDKFKHYHPGKKTPWPKTKERRQEKYNQAKQAQEVGEDINKLPKPGDINADNAKDVYKVADKYNSLNDKQKEMVGPDAKAKLDKAVAKADKAKGQQFTDHVNGLPKEITAQNAGQAYGALRELENMTDGQKGTLAPETISKVNNAVDQADAATAKATNEMISNLPDNVNTNTRNGREQINNANNMYDNLRPEAREQVTSENKSKLERINGQNNTNIHPSSWSTRSQGGGSRRNQGTDQHKSRNKHGSDSFGKH